MFSFTFRSRISVVFEFAKVFWGNMYNLYPLTILKFRTISHSLDLPAKFLTMPNNDIDAVVFRWEA